MVVAAVATFVAIAADWLPEGHLVDFLMDAVRELDTSAITSHYERELRGDPPGC